MPDIYVGSTNKTLVVWKETAQSTVSTSRPQFKAAKEANVWCWKMGEAADWKVVPDLLCIWASALGYEVERKGDWKMVDLGEGTPCGLMFMSILLSCRDEDAWLLDRYKDSDDLLEWNQLGPDGSMLLKMLEVAKSRPDSADALRILCNHVNARLLARPKRMLDAYHWHIERSKREVA